MTVKAVYRSGLLQLEQELDLPDGTTVELEIRPVSGGEQRADDSLYGAFPQLQALTSVDYDGAADLLGEAVERQSASLTEDQ